MCQKTGSFITHLLSDWQYCYLINVTLFVPTSCAHLSLDTSPQIESPSSCIPPLHQPQLPPPPTPPTPPPPQHLQHQQGAPALISRKKTRIHRSSSDPVLMDLTAKGLPFWPVCSDSKFENWYTSVRWDNHVRLMLNRNVVASLEIYDNEGCWWLTILPLPNENSHNYMMPFVNGYKNRRRSRESLAHVMNWPRPHTC